MKSKSGFWGFLFVGALGTLFHFAYDFFGQNPVAGIFFPINESIWEHLKLLFFPVVLWWLIEWGTGHRPPCFFPVRMRALVCGLGTIPVLYYTYSGIIGQRYAAVDIGIFFVADALYFWQTHRFSRNKNKECEGETLGYLLVFLVILFSFAVFTFFPPDLAFFREP